MLGQGKDGSILVMDSRKTALWLPQVKGLWSFLNISINIFIYLSLYTYMSLSLYRDRYVCHVYVCMYLKWWVYKMCIILCLPLLSGAHAPMSTCIHLNYICTFQFVKEDCNRRPRCIWKHLDLMLASQHAKYIHYSKRKPPAAAAHCRSLPHTAIHMHAHMLLGKMFNVSQLGEASVELH